LFLKTLHHPAKISFFPSLFHPRHGVVVYTGAASKREAQIKGWTRTKKLALIKGAREMIDFS